MDRFYEDTSSIFVEAYDAFYETGTPQIAGDIAFYSDIARDTKGAVLELACGTGRIALPLSAAGHDVTGVDLSEGMLSVARRKATALPPEVQNRLTLIRQNMTTLDLDRQFGFIFVPARSFQHLLTIELQKQALAAICHHLEPGGRFALHVFDPRLDLLVDENSPPPGLSGTDMSTGHRFVGDILRTRLDLFTQTRHDLWRYTETGPDGEVLREDTREMSLRWTYRWEMRHLLALCGFAVEAEYSDFQRSPPAYGKEQIWLCKAA